MYASDVLLEMLNVLMQFLFIIEEATETLVAETEFAKVRF